MAIEKAWFHPLEAPTVVIIICNPSSKIIKSGTK